MRLGAPKADYRAVLRQVPFFAKLSDEEFDVVDSVTGARTVPRGTFVISEGEISDSLYIVVRGRVKVFISDKEGREVILALMGPGEFFGEMSLIDNQPRSASVVAMEPSEFKVLSRGEFIRTIQQHPNIALDMMRALALRLREADSKISSLALMDVYARVASTLLKLAAQSKDGHTIAEKLSQQDIANMVGASREMVNRILNDLAGKGYIALEGKTIRILKPQLPESR